MPRIVDGPVASKAAGMLANDGAVLPDNDAIRIWTSTGRPTAPEETEYLFLSKETRHVFETEAMTA